MHYQVLLLRKDLIPTLREVKSFLFPMQIVLVTVSVNECQGTENGVVAISDGNTFRYASLERKVQVVITKTNGKEQHVEPVSTRTTKTR